MKKFPLTPAMDNVAADLQVGDEFVRWSETYTLNLSTGVKTPAIDRFCGAVIAIRTVQLGGQDVLRVEYEAPRGPFNQVYLDLDTPVAILPV